MDPGSDSFERDNTLPGFITGVRFFISLEFSVSQELCTMLSQFAIHLVGFIVTTRASKSATLRFGYIRLLEFRQTAVLSPGVKGTKGCTQFDLLKRADLDRWTATDFFTRL